MLLLNTVASAIDMAIMVVVNFFILRWSGFWLGDDYRFIFGAVSLRGD